MILAIAVSALAWSWIFANKSVELKSLFEAFNS